MASGNVLSAQTSSTGNLVVGQQRLLGFVACGTTANSNYLALRDSTAGTTLVAMILCSSAASSDASRDYQYNFPADGLYFKSGITVSAFQGMRSLTIFYQ